MFKYLPIIIIHPVRFRKISLIRKSRLIIRWKLIKIIKINNRQYLVTINKQILLIKRKSLSLFKNINKNKLKILKYYQNHLHHKKDKKVQINSIQEVNQKQTRNISIIRIQNQCKIYV